jgi:excisionase family DNA binding protein
MTMVTTRFPRLLTLDEVAEAANTPIATVRGWIYKGELPHRKRGRRVVVLERDLMAFLGLTEKDMDPEVVPLHPRRASSGGGGDATT